MSASPEPGTVLVVDDGEVNRRVLKAVLVRAGIQVLEATDGPGALALARERRPDLVLLDVLMPGMDGFDVLRAMKSDERLAPLPVIVLSAMNSPEDKIRGLELGAVDYITKPFDHGEVLARVRTQLRIWQLSESLAAANAELQEKQARIDEDLRAAAHLQRLLLPPDRPGLPGVHAAWCFLPAQTVGGDLLNALALSPEQVALYVLDVSGHGVPSAMVTVAVAQSLAVDGDVVRSATGPTPPDAVLAQLCRDYPFERFDRFFTMSYAVLDVRTGVLEYASAGHPPPLVLGVDGTLRALEVGGPLVGLGATEYPRGIERLVPGDRVFLYTDGLVDHEDPIGNRFGLDRLRERLVATRHQPVEVSCQGVMFGLEVFGDGRALADDVTLLGVEWVGLDVPDWTVRLEAAALCDVRRTALDLRSRARTAGLPEPAIDALELAVVEVLNNAVLHAYEGRAPGPVRLELRRRDEGLEVRVLDWGTPFSWPADAPALPDAMAEGGRGAFLVRALTDALDYERVSGCNRVTLLKRFRA